MIAIQFWAVLMASSLGLFQTPATPELHVDPSSAPVAGEVMVVGMNWQGGGLPVSIGFVPPTREPSCPLESGVESWMFQVDGGSFTEERQVPALPPGEYLLIACQQDLIEQSAFRKGTSRFVIEEPEETPAPDEEETTEQGRGEGDSGGARRRDAGKERDVRESGLEDVLGVADQKLALMITLALTGLGAVVGLASPFVRAVVRESLTHPFRRSIVRRSAGGVSVEPIPRKRA